MPDVSHFRCLVTGGAGFIGSHIVGRLLLSGHEVVCLDSFDGYYDASIKENNVKPFISCPRFRLARGSILNGRVLGACIEGADYVFHNAARPGVPESIRDPLRVNDVNVKGTLMVLEASLKAGVKKVIFASSSSVYGKALYLPLDEGHPANPVSPYGASKRCAETYCEVYRAIHGLDTVSLRYFSVFGPRMRPDLAVHRFTGSALDGRDIVVYGDGHKSRDFTYVDNVVDANLRAMSRGSGIYNIGGGHGVTMGEVAGMISALAGSRSQVRHMEDAPGDMEHTLADISKAGKELGYRPRVGLGEGLRRFVRYRAEAYPKKRTLSDNP